MPGPEAKNPIPSATRALRVLIVEDEPADAELMVALLKRAGYAVSFEIVDSLSSVRNLLERDTFDVVLSDHNLKTWTGTDVLECLRKSGKDIPFIVVTATLGDEAAVEYIKQGAADYLLKHRLERLPEVVGRALREKARGEEMARLQEVILSGKREWELTFDRVPDAIFLLNEDCHVRRANRAAVKLLGLDFNQMIGRPCHEVVHGSGAPCLHCPHQWMLQTGEEARGDIEEPRFGKVLDFTASPLRNPDGSLRACVCVVRDITDRKRAEEALRKSREHLARAQQIAHLGSWESDLVTGTLVWSDEVYRIFGVSKEQFVGTNEVVFGMVHPEDRESVLQASKKAKEERGLFHIEHRIVRPDGSVRFVDEEAEVVCDAAGQAVQMVGTVQDMTERRQLEGQFRQAQKMEAVGRLAGGIAHDFNNLLTVIAGYSDMMLSRLAADDPLRAHVSEIRSAGDRAASLTRQLLAFSRQQVLAPQVLDLNAVVANMDKMLRRLIGEHIDLVTVCEKPLWRVKADPGQLEQVIMNLAVNARDAMPKGGKLTLETANVELSGAYARAHVAVKPGRYVMLAVSDTGCGMDAETQSHLFEPFFTTKERGKGTGLGLSTVYGIVKQSGGNVWVYSEPGRGTTFKVYLPLVDEPLEDLRPVEARAVPVRGTETVLVVEDEVSVRSLVRGVLESHGYRVLEACHGADALAISDQHGGPIHLLLTDVVMPEMSGRDLASRVVPRRPGIRVLYMSGYTDDAIVHNGVLDAGTAFLQKPFTPDALAHKVREVLDG